MGGFSDLELGTARGCVMFIRVVTISHYTTRTRTVERKTKSEPKHFRVRNTCLKKNICNNLFDNKRDATLLCLESFEVCTLLQFYTSIEYELLRKHALL